MKIVSTLLILNMLATGFLYFVGSKYGGDISFGSTSFPTSLDTLTNPSGTDRVNSPSHSDQHSNANDAIEAIQTKVGIDGSSVTTTLTYKLSGVTATGTAVSTLGNQIIDGTKRFIGSLIASSTVLSAISPKFTTDIRDSAGNVLFGLTASSSAVNYFQITNAASGGTPRITPAGAGTNIAMWLTGKGSGQVELGDARLKFPDSDGSAGQVIETNGSGTLSFTTASGYGMRNGTLSFDGTTSATTTITHSLGTTPAEITIVAYGADVSGAGGDGGWSHGSYSVASSSYATIIRTNDLNAPDGDILLSTASILRAMGDTGGNSAVIRNVGATTFDLVYTGNGDANAGTVYLKWEVRG